MDYLELKEIVKKGKKKAFILYAEDEQLIIEVRDLLRKTIIKDEDSLSHIKLDGNRCTVEELQNALLTYSMFQEDILVELSNAHFINTQETSEFKKVIEAYLSDPREDLTFIAYYKYENELSKKNYYLDRLSKKISSLSIIEGIASLKPRGMVALIEDFFKKNEIEVKGNIPAFISEVYKGNSMQLERELEKLMAYTQGKEIKKEDILEIMEISDERHVMNLLDMIFTERGLGRNIKEILNLVNDLVYRGEKAEMIMGLIGSRLRLLFKIRILKEKRATTQELMKSLKTGSSWYAERMGKIASSISYEEFDKLFEILLDHEFTLKTTSVDTSSLLEILILTMVNAREIKRGA